MPADGKEWKRNQTLLLLRAETAQERLDAFREAVLPKRDWGITIYQAQANVEVDVLGGVCQDVEVYDQDGRPIDFELTINDYD